MADDRRRARVTEEDKRRMRLLGESLREFDMPRGHLVEGAALAEMIRRVNEVRVTKGIAPLTVFEDALEAQPSMIMWRRGQALSLLPSRNRDRSPAH